MPENEKPEGPKLKHDAANLLQHFTTEVELVNPVTANSTVPVRSSCADITFVNYHPTAIAYVNNIPLGPSTISGNPGGSISFGANRKEFNESNYTVLAPTPAADSQGRFTLGLFCIRKHYTKLQAHDL